MPSVGGRRTDPIPPTVAWRAGRVRLIDQRALPGRLRFVECATVTELVGAITALAVRGAPALGAAGAYGVALAAAVASFFEPNDNPLIIHNQFEGFIAMTRQNYPHATFARLLTGTISGRQ